MEKDAPSDAGTRADQSRPAGEESAPDGQLDALLATLAAASFDAERQDGPGSLRATCAFHRRDEAYVLHRKATLWAAETHEYMQVHCLPRLDMAAWERIRDGALAWGQERIRPHDEHMASYVSVIILCWTWHQDAAAAVERCRVCKSFWLGLRGWMRLRALALILPSAPWRDTVPPDAASSATRQPGPPCCRWRAGRSRPIFLKSVHHEFPVSAPWRPGPAGAGLFRLRRLAGKGLGRRSLPTHTGPPVPRRRGLHAVQGSFSSIAGAGPINGPIQAAVFGWLPCFIWVVVGGIFFGGVHDFGSLFASLRNKGRSIGEVIAGSIGLRAKRLFVIFSFLTLVLVVGAFASIVAGTFNGFMTDASGALVHNHVNGSTATISLLFIVLAVIFGLLVYRFEMPLGRATLLGVAGIVGVIALGLRFPLYAGYDTWMWLLGLYILVASVTPVWILLQPRDYLSSFLLYAMMLAAVVGIVAAHPVIELPAFTSFEVNGQYLFPALFVTVACGAISGFHSLVASGTTSKQLSSERDARLVGFGSMLIESALGIASLIAVGYIFTQNGHAFTSQTPTQVLADGLSQMLACVGLGSESARGVTYGLIILAVSTFCLTSLDTATRLGRYMFQELWLAPGQSVKDVRGWRAVLVNKYVATLVTVGLGMSLGFGGYAKIWPLFGAANQLLAALALLAVACWLQNLARRNGMFLLPMLFMLLVTLSALVLGIVAQGRALLAGTGGAVAALQLVIAVLLLALSLVLVHEGWQALRRKGRPATEKV